MADQWQRSPWEGRSLRWCHHASILGTAYLQVAVVNSLPSQDEVSHVANSTSSCPNSPPVHFTSPPKKKFTRQQLNLGVHVTTRYNHPCPNDTNSLVILLNSFKLGDAWNVYDLLSKYHKMNCTQINKRKNNNRVTISMGVSQLPDWAWVLWSTTTS